MQVVVVDVETLLGIRATATTECGMEDFATRWRRGGVGNHNDHFGVGIAFFEESAYRDKVQYLSDIPFLNEVTAEAKRLLVVQEVVLLEHAEHAAFCDHFHCFVQEEVRKLLVRQRTVGDHVALVASLRSLGVERGRERGVSRYECDWLLY